MVFTLNNTGMGLMSPGIYGGGAPSDASYLCPTVLDGAKYAFGYQTDPLCDIIRGNGMIGASSIGTNYGMFMDTTPTAYFNSDPTPQYLDIMNKLFAGMNEYFLKQQEMIRSFSTWKAPDMANFTAGMPTPPWGDSAIGGDSGVDGSGPAEGVEPVADPADPAAGASSHIPGYATVFPKSANDFYEAHKKGDGSTFEKPKVERFIENRNGKDCPVLKLTYNKQEIVSGVKTGDGFLTQLNNLLTNSDEGLIISINGTGFTKDGNNWIKFEDDDVGLEGISIPTVAEKSTTAFELDGIKFQAPDDPNNPFAVNENNDHHHFVDMSREEGERKLKEQTANGAKEESWVYVEYVNKDRKLVQRWYEVGIKSDKDAVENLDIAKLLTALKGTSGVDQVSDGSLYHNHPTSADVFDPPTAHAEGGKKGDLYALVAVEKANLGIPIDMRIVTKYGVYTVDVPAGTSADSLLAADDTKITTYDKGSKTFRKTSPGCKEVNDLGFDCTFRYFHPELVGGGSSPGVATMVPADDDLTTGTVVGVPTEKSEAQTAPKNTDELFNAGTVNEKLTESVNKQFDNFWKLHGPKPEGLQIEAKEYDSCAIIKISYGGNASQTGFTDKQLAEFTKMLRKCGSEIAIIVGNECFSKRGQIGDVKPKQISTLTTKTYLKAMSTSKEGVARKATVDKSVADFKIKYGQKVSPIKFDITESSKEINGEGYTIITLGKPAARTSNEVTQAQLDEFRTDLEQLSSQPNVVVGIGNTFITNSQSGALKTAIGRIPKSNPPKPLKDLGSYGSDFVKDVVRFYLSYTVKA